MVSYNIPPGQCHRSCNGRNRAAPWEQGGGGGGGPVQKQTKRTFSFLFFFSSIDFDTPEREFEFLDLID